MPQNRWEPDSTTVFVATATREEFPIICQDERVLPTPGHLDDDLKQVFRQNVRISPERRPHCSSSYLVLQSHDSLGDKLILRVAMGALTLIILPPCVCRTACRYRERVRGTTKYGRDSDAVDASNLCGVDFKYG